jgi:hypothetical protein
MTIGAEFDLFSGKEARIIGKTKPALGWRCFIK